MALRISSEWLPRDDASDRTSTRPRIGYVVPGFSADESDWCIPVLRNFIQEMAAQADVVLYTPHYPYRRTSYRAFGATVHCLTDGGRMLHGIPRLLLWRELWLRMAADHRERPFHLIHGFWANESGFLATRIARRLGVPSVVSIGGGELASERSAGYGAQLSPVNRFMVERSFRAADRITVGSGWLARRVPERHRGKLVTLPLGVDTSLFGTARPRTGRRILVAQSMGMVKDYPTLLRGFAIVAERVPDATLTVAGNGYEERPIHALAAELGLERRVRFLGHVPHDQMPRIYAEHDLLLHSSLYESQGMVILEALATGMPVVSTHVGVAADLAGDLVDTFAPRDPAALAERVIASLADPLHARAAAEAGPRLVARRFSLKGVGIRFREIYRDEIGKSMLSAG